MLDTSNFLIPPGSTVRLAERDPGFTAGIADKQTAEKQLKKQRKRLGVLQEVLYAEARHAVLVVLQAMDTGGKDGTISHIFTGVNPQGCQVTPFKEPSPDEARHDFLWRVHRAVPARGMIGIFNRSHYEEVLVARVHKLVPKPVWRARYDQINAFERLLAATGTVILKFYLHISKEEQARRLEARLTRREKHWKIARADFQERRFWDDYVAAYEDALSRCSTAVAPWYAIPADRKWFRNLAVMHVILERLEALKLRYPKPQLDPDLVKFGRGS